VKRDSGSCINEEDVHTEQIKSAKDDYMLTETNTDKRRDSFHSERMTTATIPIRIM
jgi:hypothetical protein